MTEIRDTLIHKNGTSKSLPVRQMALVEVSKNLFVEKLQNTSKLFFFYIEYLQQLIGRVVIVVGCE